MGIQEYVTRFHMKTLPVLTLINLRLFLLNHLNLLSNVNHEWCGTISWKNEIITAIFPKNIGGKLAGLYQISLKNAIHATRLL